MKNDLQMLRKEYGFAFSPVVSIELRNIAFKSLDIPNSLHPFYDVTNGITYEWFRIAPIYDTAQRKRTWDSIERLNDPVTSKYLKGEHDFLKKFFIFAELSGPDYAAINRKDDTIWYTQYDSLHETDLDLLNFIKTCLQEVDKL